MTWILAASVTEQLEKYGAYVGIAAFFGLAALSLLYFSQARELKRLRDWAGRAPERAAELEARVVASAQSRRVQAQPVARPAVTAPATQAGKAAVAATAGAAAAPAATAVVERPVEQAEESKPAEEAEAGIEEKTGEKAGGKPEEKPEAGTPVTDGAPAPTETATVAPPAETLPPLDIEETQEVPALVEEETGQEEVVGNGPAPAPAAPRAAALRSSPAAASPRRPAPPPRRAPQTARTRERSGINPVAAVVAVVFVLGLGAFAATQIFGGSDDAPPPNAVTPPGEATPGPEGTPAASDGEAATSLARAETQVSVFNGTTVPGLAAQTAEKLTAAGFPKPLTGNNPDQQRSATLVLYASPESRKSAQEVARLLKVSDPQRMDERARLQAGPEADVVVIVGSDQSQS